VSDGFGKFNYYLGLADEAMKNGKLKRVAVRRK
jgi:hypothetical protein